MNPLLWIILFPSAVMAQDTVNSTTVLNSTEMEVQDNAEGSGDEGQILDLKDLKDDDDAKFAKLTYYNLALWDELVISLSANNWQKILEGKVPEVAQLPTGEYFNDGLSFRRLGDLNDFAHAIQKCINRGHFLFGPRSEADLEEMKKDGNEPFWVSLDPIPASKGQYSYLNGDALPRFLRNTQNLRSIVKVEAPEEEENEGSGSGSGTEERCYAFDPQALTYAPKNCDEQKHAYCAQKTNRSEHIASKASAELEITEFLSNIRQLKELYSNVVNLVSKAWEEAKETSECLDSIEVELQPTPNVTSFDGQKSLGLIRVVEVIRANLETLLTLLRHLQDIPPNEWLRTAQGFCLPFLHELIPEVEKFPPNYTFILTNLTNETFVTNTNLTTTLDMKRNWWGFTFFELLWTICSMILAFLAIVNCCFACHQYRQRKRETRRRRRDTEMQTLSTRETRSIRCSQNQHITRTSSVRFSPLVQRRDISPHSSSSDSTIGGRIARDYIA
jgi:putative sterol carrier protein